MRKCGLCCRPVSVCPSVTFAYCNPDGTAEDKTQVSDFQSFVNYIYRVQIRTNLHIFKRHDQSVSNLLYFKY